MLVILVERCRNTIECGPRRASHDCTFYLCAVGVLATMVGCSRSALAPFDPAPAPSPTVVTNPPADEPFVLPLCQPGDESLVFEAPPPVPCVDPPIATTTTVLQITDVGGGLMRPSARNLDWVGSSLRLCTRRFCWEGCRPSCLGA